jgi:hypothetical protein
MRLVVRTHSHLPALGLASALVVGLAFLWDRTRPVGTAGGTLRPERLNEAERRALRRRRARAAEAAALASDVALADQYDRYAG